MLKKLFKYDFKALSRVMLPLQGGALLASLFGALFMWIAMSRVVYSSLGYQATAMNEVVIAVSILLAILLLSAIAASSLVTLLLIGRNYYQSLLRDEGYLSLTLPVTANQHLVSKLIAGSLWLTINAVIVAFGVFLVLFIAFDSVGLLEWLSMDLYRLLAEAFGSLPGVVLLFEVIVFCLAAVLASVLQVYLALTIGAVIAKTHKVLAGIGMYVAFSVGIQTFMSIVTFGFSFSALNSPSTFYSMSRFSWFYDLQWYFIPGLILYLALAVVFYLITRNLLKNRINLD